MEYHFKKPNSQRGDLNRRRRYQSTALLSTRPSASPKKEAFKKHGRMGETVVISGLDTSFFGEADGLVDSKAVD